MFGIFLDYFSSLITNLKFFLCFIQIYVPDFCPPQYLGLKAGPQISVTDRYQADRVRPP